MPTICLSTGKARSSTAKALIWIAQRWRIGSANPLHCWSRWLRPLGGMCWRGARSLSTTPRSRCWPQATARPRRRGCGPTGAMNDHGAAASLPPASPWGSNQWRTRVRYQLSCDRKGQHPKDHLSEYTGWMHAPSHGLSANHCPLPGRRVYTPRRGQRTAMPDLKTCIARARYARSPASPMSGASSSPLGRLLRNRLPGNGGPQGPRLGHRRRGHPADCSALRRRDVGTRAATG